jgi:uncharacterized peroxidase-related enzyme
MSRIEMLSKEDADRAASLLLSQIEKENGRVPNVFRIMAQSSAALQGYLSLSSALGKGHLDAKTRESIALTVAGANQCGYCAAAHVAVGSHLGMSRAELLDNLKGGSAEPRIRAALKLAELLVNRRGKITEQEFATAREELQPAEIVEIVAAVALSVFTNYLNHVAETEIDFPRVELDAHAAAE